MLQCYRQQDIPINNVRFVKKAVGGERTQRENRGAEDAEGADCGRCPLPTGEGSGYRGRVMSPLQISFNLFHFKMVHSGAFCMLILKFYLQSNAAKYVIMVFLSIDSDRDITRNSSAEEIANVNFSRRHHIRTTKYKKDEKTQLSSR